MPYFVIENKNKNKTKIYKNLKIKKVISEARDWFYSNNINHSLLTIKIKQKIKTLNNYSNILNNVGY